MMKLFTPNRAIAFAVFAPIFYFILSLFIQASDLRDMFNSLSFGASLVIVLTWGFSFLAAVRAGGSERKWLLILGVFVTFATVLQQRTYVAIFNYVGRPESWTLSAWSGYWPYSYMIAGALIIAASTEEKEGGGFTALPLVIAALIGGGVMGLLLGLGIRSF